MESELLNFHIVVDIINTKISDLIDLLSRNDILGAIIIAVVSPSIAAIFGPLIFSSVFNSKEKKLDSLFKQLQIIESWTNTYRKITSENNGTESGNSENLSKAISESIVRKQLARIIFEFDRLIGFKKNILKENKEIHPIRKRFFLIWPSEKKGKILTVVFWMSYFIEYDIYLLLYTYFDRIRSAFNSLTIAILLVLLIYLLVTSIFALFQDLLRRMASRYFLDYDSLVKILIEGSASEDFSKGIMDRINRLIEEGEF